jgi:hypothetical protein
MRTYGSKLIWCGLLVCILFSHPQPTLAYSVLAHQAMVDLAWENSISPLLQRRFAGLSPIQLKHARAYAYGGSIIQDMGYYPFANPFFSDLLHYVKSGDFVENLLTEARDADEYAFALGALAHYVGDNNGHALATNRVVPLYYPQLRSKYGDVVTFAQHPVAHIKVEFGFDVLQVARGHYESEDYHRFIGFNVAPALLERALQKTYGLGLKDFFANQSLAFSTYRRTVSKTIPYMTKVAWEIKGKELAKFTPDLTRERFIYDYTRKDYEEEFGKQYRKPSRIQKFLAKFFSLLPKIGPLKALQFEIPTPEAEYLFAESFQQATRQYKSLIEAVALDSLELENMDCDRGKPTVAGEYILADRAYEKLLHRLANKRFKDVPAETKTELINFFLQLNTTARKHKNNGKWRKIEKALAQLRADTASISTQ